MAKKLKQVVRTAVARADARRGERQPQSVGARGAADGVTHATFFLSGALKFRQLWAHDEFLCGEDGFHRLEEQRTDEAIFPRKIQNRHSNRREMGRTWVAGCPGRGSFFPVSHVGNVSTAIHNTQSRQVASKHWLPLTKWRR